MKELNLPDYSFVFRKDENGKEQIFDDLRKAWVAFTPEEWVRQNFVRYLISEKAYPPGLIGIEVTFKMNSLTRRTDILVYNRVGNPVLIVECKAPEIKIDAKVFDQIIAYNFKFKLEYIVVTNGIKHFACHIKGEDNPVYDFLKSIPHYDTLSTDKR